MIVISFTLAMRFFWSNDCEPFLRSSCKMQNIKIIFISTLLICAIMSYINQFTLHKVQVNLQYSWAVLQYNCKHLRQWMSSPLNRVQVCGAAPYTEVTCAVRAVYSNSYSAVSSLGPKVTKCAGNSTLEIQPPLTAIFISVDQDSRLLVNSM